MTFSKVVSGIGGAPSGLLKSGTNIASKSGKDWVSYGGRRADLDPALTFWAQLNRDTRDVLGAADTFTRASDGLYLPYNGADWRIAGTNAPRHEDAKLLIEPAITNKCTNYNANPDVALTNISKIGDPAAIVRRVLDSDELEAAGLSDICSSGYVLELDNSSGVADSALQFGGSTGNLNIHSGSAWCRKISGGGQTDLRMNDNAFITPFTNTNFQRVSGSGTPSLTTIRLRLQCAAGTVARIVVDQFEELPVITSPIITLGAAGQRAIDALQWADSASFFNQAQGMALFTATPKYPLSVVATSRENFLSLVAGTKTNIAYVDTQVRSQDGTNTISVVAPAWQSGDTVYIAVIFGPSPTASFQIGIRNGASWAWSTAGNYDGSFASVGNVLHALTAIGLPCLMSNIQVFDENRGPAWVESNY